MQTVTKPINLERRRSTVDIPLRIKGLTDKNARTMGISFSQYVTTALIFFNEMMGNHFKYTENFTTKGVKGFEEALSSIKEEVDGDI